MDFEHFDYPADERSSRPFRIFTALLHRTLGDFTEQLLFAASLKEMFASAHLDVHYKPDRPYKAEIVSLAPQVDGAWPTNNRFPIDLFDNAGMRPISGPEIWHDSNCDSPDLVLTPSMCPRERLGSLPHLARFRVPDAERWETELHKATAGAGFCVLHYREAGYEFSHMGNYRNVNAGDVQPVVDHLLDQGVQVVRIGHGGMTPLRAADGYADLSDAPFLLQAAAVSRARFFLEISPSGPSALANGFGVPMLRCNAVILAGPATPESLVLGRPILDADGRDVTTQAMAQDLPREIFIKENNGYTLGLNSAEQIKQCVDEMLRVTADVTGWRDTETPPSPPVPEGFTWPMPWIARHRRAV